MLVRVNKQPIEVTVETEEHQGIDWFKIAVSCVGSLSILSLMDYICNIFFHYHAFKFITPLTKLILWIIGG